MQLDYNLISFILIVLFGVTTLVYRFYTKKKESPNVDNIELFLEQLRPTILDILNDCLKYNYQVKDKTSFYEYWVQYCVNKLLDIDELSEMEKQFITVENVKIICEPVLDQIYNMGRK